MSYRKKCKKQNANSENLHISLSKLIHEIKDKPKKKVKLITGKTQKNAKVVSHYIRHQKIENNRLFNSRYDLGLEPYQFPTQNYIPMAQDYAISHYQVQTLEQQHQLNSEYRKQMTCLSATKDINLSYNDPYINPANFLQNPVNFVHDPYVENKITDLGKNKLSYTLNQTLQTKKQSIIPIISNISNSNMIKTKHKKDHENRVVELLKIQKRKMVDCPLDSREMQMLEKSTRTMWIGKLSEFVQERQIEFDASLYGHVMSVNIVREGDCGFIKCFGFIEFSERKCIERFMKTSNHVLAGEKISCRPGKVPSVIQSNAIAAGYVNKDTVVFTPSFEFMLEIADKIINHEHKDRKEIQKPKTISEYFPLLPT